MSRLNKLIKLSEKTHARLKKRSYILEADTFDETISKLLDRDEEHAAC